jgi:hypothetical protein
MKKWLRQIYRQLPIVGELRQIRAALENLSATLQTSNSIAANYFFHTTVLRSGKYSDPANLLQYERQVFSQNGEDGIIAEIFRRIGTKSKVFVECGVGDGLENNTAFLLFQGWQGYWIEGNAICVDSIRQRFRKPLSRQQLKLLHSFVTAENIDELFSTVKVPEALDFVSLDIDRNTYHVWKALARFKPRVVAIEYNASFPPDVEWVVDYDPAGRWNLSMHFGASLKSLEVLGREMGYVLVGCDFTGMNAFFIRDTERKDLFVAPFTSEHHYEPPRYWMCRREGHPPCFDDSD